CGGACSCATCHVYVDVASESKLIPPDEIEQEMLEVADNVRENSRLACQLSITDKLDGLVVTTPQY
ncbi:MAG: 2Fe-2S iron-sulfur cluster-binding protein, partial [Pseudomonadales bacterium]